jgi:ubiquinone/menaquinone biosynthesis C-methylase UbiE
LRTPDPPGAARPSPPSAEEIAGQFGAHAREYAVSRLHREGAARLLLLERMEPVVDEALLDVACGPAHVALAFAPYVRRAVGLDLSPEMLQAARLGARRAGVALDLVAGDAHRLPFPGGSFDLVACRAAPHHFAVVGEAVREMARVLRRGGRLGIADGTVPEDAELDRFINQLDALHDPTTVRNWRPSEWRALVEGAGLRLDWMEPECYELPEGRSLTEWIARSGGSSAVLDEARRRLLAAPERVRRYLRVREAGADVTFDLPRVVLVARRLD